LEMTTLYRRRLNEARRATLELLRPVERMPLSDYIEKVVYLPSGLSAVSGPIKLWPFQRGICDALTEYERVSVIKGARLGWSTLLAGVVAFYAKVDPSSILCVLPTADDARNFLVSQLESVFAASPELKDAIPITRSGPFGNFDTMRYRRFPGGSLRIAAARSGRELRAVSSRCLIIDESDAMIDIPEEGNPILLAEKRTMSFPNRRILIGSTPTTTTTSYVHNAYLAGDCREYRCPCPSCQTEFELRWRDIRWPEGKPEDAAWCCPSCGVLHGEEYKSAMVEAGRWVITRPEVKDHASFRMSCLIAPHGPAAWGKLAVEFLAAKRRPESLRTFVNTVLGEPWEDDSDGAPQPHELAALAEDISLDNIPEPVLYLTSSCDIQTGGNGRLEISTVGFDADDHWYVLDHRVIFGDPMRDEVWRDLADLIAERYPHPLGGMIGRDATVIDCGDGNVMQRALAFCAGHRNLRCIPVKGASGQGRAPLTPTASKRNRSLMVMGSDTLKVRIFDRLAKRTGITFSATLDQNYYEQILSERQVVRYQRGRPTRVFERYPGRNAESLDCLVMSLAARSAVAIPTPRREAELSGRPVSTPIPSVIRSAYLERA
jgi:phage terminase large subunit GpA-like protein